MGRTWLVRGVVVAVIAVLAAAWGVEVSGVRDAHQPVAGQDTPAEPERSEAPDTEPAVKQGKVKGPRIRRSERPGDDRTTEPPTPGAPETADETTPTPPTPTEPGVTPSPSDQPTDRVEDPSDGPPPTPTPDEPSTEPTTEPTSEPTRDCTDLLDLLDCVLNPITSAP